MHIIYIQETNASISSFLLLAATFLTVACATTSIVELPYRVERANCLYSKYKIALLRGYLSAGLVSPSLKVDLATLEAAGFKNVSIYMDPCLRYESGSKQVEVMFRALGTKRRRVVVYVSAGTEWKLQKNVNRKFLLELVHSLDERAETVIATNEFHWGNIMGKDFQELAAYPLLHIDEDEQASCKGFKPFGGWKKIWAKKYQSLVNLCSQITNQVVLCDQNASA